MYYTFSDVVKSSLYDLYLQMMGILPDLIGALVIIIVGLIVAPIFGGIVKKLIDVIQIDKLAEKTGLLDALRGYFKKPSISVFFGKIVKWFFLIAFLMAAAEVLNWSQVTEFLNKVILYIPNVLIAAVILVIGLLAGKFAEEVTVRSIKGSNAPVNHPEALGKVSKYALVIFAVLAAFLQLGIAPSLIEILFAGVVLAMALAFGLGGREKAAKLLDYLDGAK
jgi:small-conductance mechanosensitive channel